MKITGLEVDGYGVWSGLKLEGLTDGLNVLYGPNEAGKTTLLQFIRSVLYGFSPARRKYLPPLRGGRPGGSLDLAGPGGRFRLDRHRDAEGDDDHQEQVTLTAADGTRQGEHLVKVLLCNVEEPIYNNVFAVGLREMQELGTLSDTDAAELLYSLTAGLDRVSLLEVTRELQTSRNRILDRDGRPCQVVQLLEQREKLRLEIEELGKLTRRYGRLAAERNQLDREVTRLEEENNHAEHLARVVELAITLRDRWTRRAALDGELATLAPAATVPHGAVDRLDALNVRLQRHQQRAEQLKDGREQLRAEAAGLGINEKLWRQAARIEALREQESWIATLQNQAGELEAEIAELQSTLAAEQERLGLGGPMEPGFLPSISAHTLSTLKVPAGALKQCRRRVMETRQEVATANETAEALSGQIETALSARGQSDLAGAMEGAGNLAAQLRRRLQIDERLDEMGRYQRELEQQSRRLVDRELLPVWVLLGLGAVFVLGVVLVMAGLFMPASVTGSVGWWLALLGLAGSGFAGAGKVMLERSNARQLDACQRQIDMLQKQIQQARDERDALDQQLLRGDGPITSRLEAAEKELAALEELAPLDARRTAAQQEAQAAAGRLNLAEEKWTAAVRRWREALAAAGLPQQLSPKQVRQLVRQHDRFSEQHRRLAHRREELGQRRRELDSLVGRIRQLVDDTGLAATGNEPVEQLRQLGQALQEQETRAARRDVLRREARQLRRQRAKHQRAISQLKRRRWELLRESDCGDEQEFRRRALQAARAEVLRKERDALAREMTAAIAGSCPEEAVGQQLESDTSDRLEPRRDELLERLGTLEKELKERFQKRGQLAEQLRVLAENKQMMVKQLELATVERRLEEAIGRWQVLAVTSRVLEVVRTTYEKERQPETLQEASGYLNRLTQGRYRRVWTPLGEEALRVDDAQGSSLAVEVLSRGAREQLFLALRLALAASYARRGAPLPLVLDDVLVNFDADRAKAAAAVLRDFAAAGHQLLVFTCHQHILKLFQSLKLPVSRLPDNTEADHAPITFEQPAQPKRKRSRKAPPPVEEVEEPEDEMVAVEDGRDDEIVAAESDGAEVFAPPDEDVPWDEEEDLDVPEIEPDDEYDEDEEDEYEEDEYEEDEEEYLEDEEDDTAEAA